MGKSIFEQQRQPAAGPFDLLQFVPQLSANLAELTRLQQMGARLMRDMRDDQATTAELLCTIAEQNKAVADCSTQALAESVAAQLRVAGALASFIAETQTAMAELRGSLQRVEAGQAAINGRLARLESDAPAPPQDQGGENVVCLHQ